jgi:hypothetical protein
MTPAGPFAILADATRNQGANAMVQKWADKTPDEKLDWLKEAVDGIIEASNYNVKARTEQTKTLNNRLDSIEEALTNISREVDRIRQSGR